MLRKLFGKKKDPKEVVWGKLQSARAGSLAGSNRIMAIAILYENPRNIALPPNERLAGILVDQYRGPDLIPNNLSIEPETRIVARKLVYGQEISETGGLDTSGSNKILADMLAGSVDLDSIESSKAMAFTGDSPALGQTFFALLTS